MDSFSILMLMELPKIGRKTVKKLCDELNLKSLNLDNEEIVDFLFELKPKLKQSFSEFEIKKAKRNAEKIIEDCRKLELTVIPVYSNKYPIQYYDLKDEAPVILYAKGNISSLSNQNNIAIIGTRNNSINAEQVGDVITKEFVNNNFFIISGLAKGCDTIAHKSCLKHNGTTIAILANGLNTIYPKENRELADHIIEKGCIVSEYPPYSNTMSSFFVERDRLQSGLSKGVVVIETDIKGGSMHTVNFALSQNRKVACVNYKEIYDLDSIRGNRKLISEGTAFGITKENIKEFIGLLSANLKNSNIEKKFVADEVTDINSEIEFETKGEINDEEDIVKKLSHELFNLNIEFKNLIKNAKANVHSWNKKEKAAHNKSIKELKNRIIEIDKKIKQKTQVNLGI
jgi:DNA processing protein